MRLDRDRPGAANGGIKALSVLGAMLAGGDSIEDVNVLRAGAAPALFDDLRAPSTVGTWLRAFRWHNVRELDAVCRETLKAAWAAGLGPEDLTAPLTIDVDSTVCQAYGLKSRAVRSATPRCAAITRSSPRWRRLARCCMCACAAATLARRAGRPAS